MTHEAHRGLLTQHVESQPATKELDPFIRGLRNGTPIALALWIAIAWVLA